MGAKVVILAGRSLFTEGVISKLRRSSQERNFEVVDMCQPDPLSRIEFLRPDVIIVDGSDPEYIAKLQGNTFPTISHLKIIFIDSQSARTRVLQWEEHDTTQIADLLAEMGTPNNLRISTDADSSHLNSNFLA